MAMAKGQVTGKVAWRRLVERAFNGESVLLLATFNGKIDQRVYEALRLILRDYRSYNEWRC